MGGRDTEGLRIVSEGQAPVVGVLLKGAVGRPCERPANVDRRFSIWVPTTLLRGSARLTGMHGSSTSA